MLPELIFILEILIEILIEMLVLQVTFCLIDSLLVCHCNMSDYLVEGFQRAATLEE